jgi:hypothetical protein
MRFLPLLALLGLVASTAFAQDTPRRKSGLWEITMTSPQMPQPMTTQQCVDEKTDDLAARPQHGQEKCSKQSVRREGGNVIVEAVCQIEGSTATSRGVFAGDFATSYRGEMVTRFSPPMHGMTEMKMSFQARHSGPCAPGQKPGAVGMKGAPGGQGGSMDAEQARRMAEEMMKKYQK